MDLFGTPDLATADIQKFYASQPGVALAATADVQSTFTWQTWTKPRGKSMCSIICIGGGGGGGGARGAAANTDRGGGGGGGSSGLTRCIYPIWVLPDTLYVVVGQGGAGGAGGSSGDGVGGSPGQLSYVSMYPNQYPVGSEAVPAVNNLFAVSGATAALGGGGGAGTGNAAAGAASTIATIAGCVFSCWGITQFIAGKIGTVGGVATGNQGSNGSVGTAVMIASATGGGGIHTITTVGGSVTSVANTPFSTVNGGIAGAGPGNPGFLWGQFPGLEYAGTGGGSSNTVTGGAGGNGFCYGAGGGGGGGGVTIGGAGGAGGPGIVIITSW